MSRKENWLRQHKGAALSRDRGTPQFAKKGIRSKSSRRLNSSFLLLPSLDVRVVVTAEEVAPIVGSE